MMMMTMMMMMMMDDDDDDKPLSHDVVLRVCKRLHVALTHISPYLSPSSSSDLTSTIGPLVPNTLITLE